MDVRQPGAGVGALGLAHPRAARRVAQRHRGIRLLRHRRPNLRPERRGSTEVWTAELDGRRHTTTLHGRGGDGVPELDALSAALEAATQPG